MDKQKRINIRNFRRSLREFERIQEVLMKEHDCCSGLSITLCHPLLEIDELGTSSLGDLAAKLNLDPSSLSRTVEALVQQDFVRREPDSRDRRFVVLSLTPKGKKLCDEINGKNDLLYEQILAKMSDKKRRAAIQLLNDLAHAIRTTVSPCPECHDKK
jgi:DNA-binding MarR family transcriptional regulator